MTSPALNSLCARSAITAGTHDDAVPLRRLSYMTDHKNKPILLARHTYPHRPLSLLLPPRAASASDAFCF